MRKAELALTKIDELRSRAIRAVVLLPLGVLLGFVWVQGIAQPASATFACGSFVGTDVDFNNVRETASFGGSEPLFCSGPEIVSGNSLTLFPNNFSATASGAFGFAQTGSQLQAMVVATGAMTIDEILITEFGDTDLSGVGTGATGTFASMSGFATVTANLSGPIAPVVVNFIGTFTPTDTLVLNLDPGLTLWSGSTSIDIASAVPNATKATLSFDNDLFAFSESGTTALIQKKVGGPLTITVIPEPGSAALLGAGLLGILAVVRRSRLG